MSRPTCTDPGLPRRLAAGALDFLLPPHCALCDTPVDQAGQLCGACFARLSFIAVPLCARCGVPFAAAAEANDAGCCAACATAPPLFGAARAALRYDDAARGLLLPFKHADRQEFTAVLGPMMARAGVAVLERAEVLVPVPLHRRRLFTRKYNQAALLAVVLGQIAGRAVALAALTRTRPTASLGEKSATERAAEVADAFRVAPRHAGAVAGRNVLLVDDVMTSGATANACAAALLTAGARSVDVLVAARVPDPRAGQVIV